MKTQRLFSDQDLYEGHLYGLEESWQLESFLLYLVHSLAIHSGGGMLTAQGVPLVILLGT